MLTKTLRFGGTWIGDGAGSRRLRFGFGFRGGRMPGDKVIDLMQNPGLGATNTGNISVCVLEAKRGNFDPRPYSNTFEILSRTKFSFRGSKKPTKIMFFH